mmetsp:Transcript_1665/g.2578  ORF Transcript_1665/g.2578 Transcript_1665/m.2578 type:complete len:237 (-) Transcript_1665:50-760(-)|eukprot:CAMPEP_0119023684 /NCGR_PEP_ID=MMETSP1176-20130426/30434_1 /TAXON_ID=265551 /ORGANISM="Synedropsis recta cf, Strain CCMP1620" /LENGTH=236 /DNA_ID=CAMNT_0006978793 /DNA_START=107 /DNA_END=817 /DNA_ORIENTATION=+
MQSPFILASALFAVVLASSSVHVVRAWTPGAVVSRRAAVRALVAAAPFLASSVPDAAAKCTDIESCREIGEQKVEKDLKDNPRYRLDGGVSYKLLKPGVGTDMVAGTSTVDLIFSVTGSNGYMYSRGFGFEKIDVGNGKKVTDLGIDSYLAPMGKGLLPVGIESALVGMKRGERRRVVLPPDVGLETSDWKPEPQTFGGKQSIVSYKRVLAGNGSSQPPYMAPTIWDIEVVSMRNK